MRLGRFGPLLISGIVHIICFILWPGVTDYAVFVLIFSAIAFFWNFPLGYHLGVLIREDASNRFIVFVPFIQMSGIAAGPVIGGIAMEQGGMERLALTATIALVMYLLLILPLAFQLDRQKQVTL